ncbi:MAG TPA: FHA domain-containing protein, partial [Candidatus Elarobacter sp.]|nr:FHA domain-containing protein [Candidatus Elarobacter sp.]
MMIGDRGITVRWSGNERRFAAGATLRIGRDPTCDIVIDNRNVSRVHAELAFVDGVWQLSDATSSQGTFVGGERVTTFPVTGTTTAIIGRPDLGTPIELVVQDDATVQPDSAPTTIEGATAMPPSETPPEPVSDRTAAATPQRPGGELRQNVPAAGTVVVGDTINVECDGRSYSFEPGAERVIGRDDDCDVASANPTVSRRHAALRHDGRAWRLDDLASTGGMYANGRRVQS